MNLSRQQEVLYWAFLAHQKDKMLNDNRQPTMTETLTEAQQEIHKTKHGCLFALSVTLEYVDGLKHSYKLDGNPYLTNCCSGVERTSTALFNAIKHEVLKGYPKAQKEEIMNGLYQHQDFIFRYFSLDEEKRNRLYQIIKTISDE